MIMKRFLVVAVAIIMVGLSGCGVDLVSYPTNHCTYQINNTSDKGFAIVVEVEPMKSYLIRSGDVPTRQSVNKETTTIWVSELDFEMNLFADEYITFSFHFDDGVKHTFNGELIENDFRDPNSWMMDMAEGENGVPYYTYTYTFSDEDYERIMALYE